MNIKVKVKTLDGKDHEIEVDSEAQLSQLRTLIAERTNISSEQQRLIFRGKPLTDNNKTLAAYGIQDGLTLHLVERVPRLSSQDASGTRPGPSRQPAPPSEGQAELQHRGRNMVVGNIPVERTGLFQNPQETLRVIQEALEQIRSDWNIETTSSVIENRPNDGDFSINIVLRGLRERHADSPARARIDQCYFFLRRQRYILFYIERVFHERIDSILSDPEGTGLQEGENGETVFRQIVRTIREIEDTDLMNTEEIQNNEPDIFQELESIRSLTETYPEDDTHLERISDDFTMRYVTGEDLHRLLQQVMRVQEIINRETERYSAVLRLDRSYEANSFIPDILNAYTTSFARLLHRQAHIHHIISDINIHMENAAPRRLYPQYTNYVRDEPPFADLSILFYHPRNSSPSHSPQMAARRAAAAAAFRHSQNGMFMQGQGMSPSGLDPRAQIRMAGGQPGQNSFVRLPGGGTLQNQNMHFNVGPNVGVRVNIQRAQIPVTQAQMQQMRMMRPGGPGMPGMPGMPGQAQIHIRMPRGMQGPGMQGRMPMPGMVPQGAPMMPPPSGNQPGSLPNPSFMEFARNAGMSAPRGFGSQPQGNFGAPPRPQNGQRPSHPQGQQGGGQGGQQGHDANNVFGMVGNLLKGQSRNWFP